jgi:hypothetical protein
MARNPRYKWDLTAGPNAVQPSAPTTDFACISVSIAHKKSYHKNFLSL